MMEHSAEKIAQSVDLAEVLRSPLIDNAKFQGAGTILASMVNASINKGPFDGIEKYRNAESAVLRYLKHARTMAKTLVDLKNISKLAKLVVPENDGGCLEKVKFGKEASESIARSCRELLLPGRWEKTIINNIRSDSYTDQWDAIAAANSINLDVKPQVKAELENHPLKPPLWFYLIQTADDNTIDDVVDLAQKLLLNQASGQRSDDMQHGNLQQSINFFIQDLEKFPGKGWDLIEYTLDSPHPSVRNMALKLLHTWTGDIVSQVQLDKIAQMQEDPDDMVRLSISNLLGVWGVN
jgi:hypothetical protein